MFRYKRHGERYIAILKVISLQKELSKHFITVSFYKKIQKSGKKLEKFVSLE